MCRPGFRLRRRLRRLSTVARTGFSNRSSVAALAVDRRSLTSGSRWPWRSMDSTKWGRHAKEVVDGSQGPRWARLSRQIAAGDVTGTHLGRVWQVVGWSSGQVSAGGAIRKGVAGRAIGPGHERTGPPGASAGEGAE